MTNRLTLVVAVLVALTGTAFANEVQLPQSMDKAGFETTKAHLVQQLDSDRYSEISPKDKRAVIAALDRIDARLSRTDATGQLNDQDRVDTFNDQELINTITSHAVADSRMYCEREAPTGSHKVQVICLTMAVWMDREKTGQTAMHTIQTHQNESYSGAE
jgi:hypothetical protein